MTTPPHLPPKSCSVPLYRRLRLVESIIFVSALAFLSGLVGGIISDTYITPEYYEYTGVVQTRRVVTQEKQPEGIDPLFVRDQYRRTVSLVPKKIYEQTEHVPEDLSTTAVLLTDTGWFVAPAIDTEIDPATWVAVSQSGESYVIKNIVFDAEKHVMYGALEGTGFRIISFPTIDALASETLLLVSKQSTLERSVLSYPQAKKDIATLYSPGESVYSFSLEDPAPVGSVVWTEDGAFFGFVDRTGSIIPWYVIQSMYTNVFEGISITYPLLPFRGYTVRLTEEEADNIGSHYGFYIEDVDAGVNSVSPGDVIVRIEDQSFDPMTLQAYILLNGSNDIQTEVLRNGERIEKTIIKKVL